MDSTTIAELIALIVVVALVLIDLATRIFALLWVPRNRRPQTAMAWLLAITFMPFLGFALFLLLGSWRLPRSRREKQDRIDQLIAESTSGVDAIDPDEPLEPWMERVVELNRRLGAIPLVGGNAATQFADDQASLDAMIADIRAATQRVHVEFYILLLDQVTAPFFDALAEARARGVIVRVLLDHLGCFRYPGYRRTIRRLDEIGVQWRLMLPVQPLKGRWQRPDLRNHRKLLTIDGRIGWNGSQNIIETGYQRHRNHRRGLHWLDYMARFEGPVVAAIDAVFVSDWYAETNELLLDEVQLPEPTRGTVDCQLVPSGPGFAGENNLRLFNALVYAARRRITLVSPYFVPDDSMLYAITTAAESGVEVELIASEIGDQFFVFHAQRSYYEALLRAGVRIFLYRAPTILHAKHMVFDDAVAVIGSSNLDMRSFTLDLEVSMMVHDRGFVGELIDIQQGYKAQCRELELEPWLRRPLRHQLLDNVARLTAALQ